MRKLWLGILLIGCLVQGQAQSIWDNPITGTNPNTANPYTTGQTVNANITVSGIGRGSGIAGSGATDRYSATGWNSGALDATDYFEFTLTPNPGCEIDFVSFVYTAQASGTGPASYAFRSSLDGFTANIGTPSATGTTISLVSATYQNITSGITFRLYGWGASAAGGTFSVNSFTFNGSTNCSAPCTPPTVQAGSVSSTPVTCSSVTINWIRGNGNAVLVTGIGGAVATTNPTNGTTYTGNSVFTAGTGVGGGYAVYTGNGTSVTITGLSGNTQYTFAVYEYATTGTCYLSPPATITFTTTACSVSQCPYITSVLINACDGSCNEGDNEIIFANSGSSAFNATPANIQTYYGSAAAPTTNFTESFATNATTISAMNTAAGCGSLFIDASSGISIPANSPVMIVRSSMCQNAYDWTSLCGSGPIYVLFSTDASWAVGGNFVNGGGIRYFRTTYSGCVMDYSYDSDQLTGGNGAYIVYGTSGGAPAGYFNSGCALSVIVLPVTIDSFDAKKIGNSIQLNWLTSAEINVSHYEIEKSADGLVYTNQATITSNNSNRINSYTFSDEQPYTGMNYYRLYSIDISGYKQYHSTIAYSFNKQLTDAYVISYSPENIELQLKEISLNTLVCLYDLSGQLLRMYTNSDIINGNIKLKENGLESGMYLLKISQNNKIYNDKIIIRRGL